MPAPASIDDDGLARAGGVRIPNGIRLHGWDITVTTAPISGEAGIEALKHTLGHDVLALPEQLFGGSSVVLTHPATSTTLRFDARGALHAWHEAKQPSLKVPVSQAWQQARQQELSTSHALKLEYDWTFTTPYVGETESTGTMWQSTEEGLNRALLTARDPILLYAEVPLYVSELDDHGLSCLDCKIRVMPRCAYVLLRFYLRVDKVLVRLRETRLCVEFTADARGRIVRECKTSEGTFQELQAGGAPPAESAAYMDADSASVALQAVAPTGVRSFVVQHLVSSQS